MTFMINTKFQNINFSFSDLNIVQVEKWNASNPIEFILFASAKII